VAVQVTIDLSVQVNAPGAACTYFDGFYHELDEAFLPGIKSHPYISPTECRHLTMIPCQTLATPPVLL
jgi:hypothetical protein